MTVAEQKAQYATAVKALADFFAANPACKEIAYEMGTIVNNLPDDMGTVLNYAYDVQDEYANATDFRMEFISKALRTATRAKANGAKAYWKGLISKWSDSNPTIEISREGIEMELLKKKDGVQAQQRAELAEVILNKVKS